jgi:TrmH family RNA methyltransferase
MGALARVQVHYADEQTFLSVLSHAREHVPVYGTLLDGQNIYAPDALPDKHAGIIVMGNEGNGLSAEVRRLVTHRLRIPSFPPDAPTSESLNVAIATAVVLAEFRR